MRTFGNPLVWMVRAGPMAVYRDVLWSLPEGVQAVINHGPQTILGLSATLSGAELLRRAAKWNFSSDGKEHEVKTGKVAIIFFASLFLMFAHKDFVNAYRLAGRPVQLFPQQLVSFGKALQQGYDLFSLHAVHPIKYRLDGLWENVFGRNTLPSYLAPAH